MSHRYRIRDDPKDELHSNKGTKRPLKSELYFVCNLPGVLEQWRDLGVQLLHEDDFHFLEEIEIDRKDKGVRVCCTKMFDKWLNTRHDASWNQLYDALNEIKLRRAAQIIKKNFYKDDSDSSIKPEKGNSKNEKYYTFMMNIANQLKAEGVDLRPAKQLILTYCYSDALVTACDENNHHDFIAALLARDKPVSVDLMEEIAKQIKSEYVLFLISQYRGGTTHESDQLASTGDYTNGNCWSTVKSSIKKLQGVWNSLGWKQKTILIFATLVCACCAGGWMVYAATAVTTTPAVTTATSTVAAA